MVAISSYTATRPESGELGGGSYTRLAMDELDGSPSGSMLTSNRVLSAINR